MALDEEDRWRLPREGEEIFGSMRHAGAGVWVPSGVASAHDSPDAPLVRALAVGTVIFLASPLAWSRIYRTSGNLPDSITMTLIRYLDLFRLGDVTPAVRATEPYARALFSLYESWALSEHLPEDIASAARGFLSAAGVPAPPDGWDMFSGDEVHGRTAQAAEQFGRMG
jgi:hypothetical protein